MTGLVVDGISHAYDGAAVLHRVSLAVPRGRVACLLGPSGCGKTTALRLAAGLERLQKGRISIGGRTVADPSAGFDLAPEHRRVGLMFQDYALFPHLTVAENVAFGLGGAGRRSSDRNGHAVAAALARLGLASHAGSYPHVLSGGEQQRCALLRALAPEPDVLLLDEPFSGLDVTLRAQVRESTLEILRDSGVATLIVTHDPEEAMFLADRLLIMERGRVVQEGTPEAIYLNPGSAFVAGLFGAPNRLAGRVDAGGGIDSPLGRIAAPDLAPGQRAIVLIRPEGLAIREGGSGDDGPAGRIVAARLLGRASQLRIAVDGLDEPVQALIPGVVLPAVGAPVTIVRDAQRTFVFPDDPP